MVVVTTIFNLSTLLLNYWYCIHKIKIQIHFRKFQWGFLKEIGIYSFFIFLNVIIDRIYWSTGQFVLGTIVGTTAVAVFAVAIQLQQMYMGFSSAISGVFFPKITAMITLDQSKKTISDLFIKTGRLQYIVMAFILTGFILFGKYFILFWAGKDYADTYFITLIFFIPLTVPLIQNIGITILQARNQMKFRSLLYIVIALGSLALQIPLAKMYGGIGCAIGISIALVLGQIIAMNIYYHKKQGIDIPAFWKEIGKMSLTPIVLSIITFLLLQHIPLNTIPRLGMGIGLFSLVYIPLFWLIGMNQYERDLLGKPVKRYLLKFIK